jgi:hypothetical protein
MTDSASFMSEYYALQRHCTNMLSIGEAKVRQATRVGSADRYFQALARSSAWAIVDHTTRGKPLPKQSLLREPHLDPDCDSHCNSNWVGLFEFVERPLIREGELCHANCSLISPVVFFAAS